MSEPGVERPIPEQLLAETRLKIQREMREQFPGEKGVPTGYLNNFKTLFIPNSPGIWNKQRNVLIDGELTTRQVYETHFPHINPDVVHSPKMLNKKGKDFVADVKRAMQEEGIVGKEADDLEKLIEGQADSHQINGKILPVYVRLRAMGYEHHDLTS